MNGVRPPRFRPESAIIAFVADVSDVETGVDAAGGDVASGGQSWHFEAPMQRREAVHFDVRRSFTYDEQLVAE